MAGWLFPSCFEEKPERSIRVLALRRKTQFLTAVILLFFSGVLRQFFPQKVFSCRRFSASEQSPGNKNAAFAP
ncbi:hypothetical protein [Salaquimonas pukyongi]|uniref:hypothetical protein n=1 Tax=Salaquimonas pukyongi TaxID=2712698 RepID=UPI0012EC11D0|nr:hypothetical protein [Salaquimonas pukyongi]